MKLINQIAIFSIIQICAFSSGLPVQAAVPSIFPEKSVLADGKWVKLHLDKTGVYELTFDELREMGFDDPYSVGLYGRGGGLQPTQFVNNNAPSYMSDLQPVSMMYKDNKIYFFAQANQKIRYCHENDIRANSLRFQRESNQVFSEDVVYFITDTPKKRSLIETVTEGNVNNALPALGNAWSYYFHEVDKFTPLNSSREFFGESFLSEADRVQTFPYSLPGAVIGSQACVAPSFAVSSGASSTLKVGFKDGESASFTIGDRGDYNNYKYLSKAHVTLPINESDGELVMTFTPASDDISFAALDYFVIGARREMKFQEGETQFMVFPYEFTCRKYRGLQMPEVKDTYVVWQVTDSGEVKELSYDMNVKDNTTTVRYLEDNHVGPVLFFDYAQEQYKINSYEPVANQNLHALGLDKIPSMLIITLPELKPAADRLAQIHKDYEGIDVAVVLHQDVVNEFSAGVDDPMAYRAIAKMIYDRDNPDRRVFKNILLLGPNVRDHRNILGLRPSIGTLISNQGYDASLYDFSYCLNDWYGMMDDTTEDEQTSSYNFQKVPMHLGVGIMPFSSLETANSAVDKVAKFYADDSYAYWLGNYNYCADGGDNNEHQDWQENLSSNMRYATNNGGIGYKVYSNICTKGTMGNVFRNNLNDGSLLSFYTGHAFTQYIGSNFIDIGDERKFTNNRYGFGLLGACMLAPFDNNTLGVGEKLFAVPDKAFVATLASSRDGYSRHNYNLINHYQYFLMYDELNSDRRLSAPRTLGEAYALAKSAVVNHPNKFIYHLFGDPAIVLPMPTGDVTVTLEGDAANGLYPGSEINFNGVISDRDGKVMSDFNGTVVVKVCSPAREVNTSSYQESPSVKVTLDHTVLMTVPFDVKEGKFKGSLLIPAKIPQSDSSPASLRFSAYDPKTRIAAIGGVQVGVKAYDSSKAVTTDAAPVIEKMYVNDISINADAAVPSNFVLHADITDDYGVNAFESNAVPAMYLTVDNSVNYINLAGYVTMSDGGKRAHLAYPLSELCNGPHILTLTASDASDQKVSRNLSIRVGSAFDASGFIPGTEGPARTEAILNIADYDSERTNRIRILDSFGNLVLEQPVTGGRFVWNLKDKDGKRVDEGVYNAVNIQTIQGKGTAVSEPCRIIVFK